MDFPFSRYLRSIALIIIGAMLFSCENDISVVQNLQVDKTLPIETSFDVESVVVDSGRIRVRIFSPVIDRYVDDEEGEYIEMSKGVKVLFYDSIGVVSSSLTSEYAINRPGQREIVAKYNVQATNSSGEKLFTEKLVWDQKKRQIFTDVKVKVESEDKIIFGDGLVADESFDNWQIQNPSGDIEAEQLNIDE
jgi:LPS export ABC transporter protein LptC